VIAASYALEGRASCNRISWQSIRDIELYRGPYLARFAGRPIAPDLMLDVISGIGEVAIGVIIQGVLHAPSLAASTAPAAQ
jgi:hypothetical protein